MRTACVALCAAAILGGCAKDASDIGATYVSPILYENYTCPQLAEEAQRVSARAAQASGVQDTNATHDRVTTVVIALANVYSKQLADVMSAPGVQAALQTLITAAVVYLVPANQPSG